MTYEEFAAYLGRNIGAGWVTFDKYITALLPDDFFIKWHSIMPTWGKNVRFYPEWTWIAGVDAQVWVQWDKDITNLPTPEHSLLRVSEKGEVFSYAYPTE